MQQWQWQVNWGILKFLDNTYLVKDERESVFLRFLMIIFFLTNEYICAGKINGLCFDT